MFKENGIRSAPEYSAQVSQEPKRRSSRRPDIQGLRALAVLFVVAFHAGLPFPGGFVGVDVFFVISGFVITAMLQRERRKTGRIEFTTFYLRRFKRLTPALALVVAVTVVLSAALLSPLGPQQVTAATAAGAILLSANLVIARETGDYFDAPAETNPLLNTWSLSVEEQFYIVFPALLALSWKASRQANLLIFSPILVVSLVAAISFSLAILGPLGDASFVQDFFLGFYSPFTRAWEFAVGALLALVTPKLAVASRGLALTFGFLGLSPEILSLHAASASRASVRLEKHSAVQSVEG